MLNQVKKKGRVLGEKSMGCCMGGRVLQWEMGGITRLRKASKRKGHFKQNLNNEWEFMEDSEEEHLKQRKEPEDRIRFDIFRKQKQDQYVESVVTKEERSVR